MTTVGTRVVVNTVDHSCSRSLRQSRDLVTGGNKAYLSDYEDLNGGFVAFGSDPKGVHMANLKYSDKHNMVAFLKKPNESVGFTEVVDFLKGTSLRYALTHNPTIYDSLVKQFWQTATVRTLANGTQQLVASIDSKEYTITEASVRSKLQLADATGIHNLSDAEIYAGLATLGYVTEGAAVDQGEGSAQPAEPHHTHVAPIPSTSQPPPPSPTLITTSFTTTSFTISITTTFPASFTTSTITSFFTTKDIDNDPLVSLVRESMKKKSTNFVTPKKSSGEAQEEEISPTILEVAKTLSKVASQGVSKENLTDKGKRYRRRARSMAKKIDTGLDAEEEIITGREEINTGIEEVTTGSTKVDSGTASKRG
ncbi:hypothetical protein Tco_0720073 [Tanacetum coccineum]